MGVKYIPFPKLYLCRAVKLFVIFSINTNYKKPFRVIFRPLTKNFGRSGRAGKKWFKYSYSTGKKLPKYVLFFLIFVKV